MKIFTESNREGSYIEAAEKSFKTASGNIGLDTRSKLVEEVIRFLEKHPNPSDEDVHSWAETEGHPKDKVEESIYVLASAYADFASHGRSNEEKFKKADADPKELAMGVEVEHEHADDPKARERIALDHLAEAPSTAPMKYYTGLKLLERMIESLAEMGKDEANRKIDQLNRFVDGMEDGKDDGWILDELKNFVKSTEKDWNYILPEDLHNGTKKFFILDVRKPEDFKEGHIKGAVNVFWLDLLDNLGKLPKDRKIVVVCYVGHAATQAMMMLRLLGYDAAGLKFGMGVSPAKGVPVAGWMDYGFEVEK